MVVTSRWGGDTAYLGDSVYHVRLKSGQMISAQHKTPIVIVKVTDWATKCVCAEVDSLWC